MGPVDPKTVIACFQLVSGGSLLGSAYHWRPASPVSKSGWLAGVISIAMGIQALTSGAVHYAAMALASIRRRWRLRWREPTATKQMRSSEISGR